MSNTGSTTSSWQDSSRFSMLQSTQHPLYNVSRPLSGLLCFRITRSLRQPSRRSARPPGQGVAGGSCVDPSPRTLTEPRTHRSHPSSSSDSSEPPASNQCQLPTLVSDKGLLILMPPRRSIVALFLQPSLNASGRRQRTNSQNVSGRPQDEIAASRPSPHQQPRLISKLTAATCSVWPGLAVGRPLNRPATRPYS